MTRRALGRSEKSTRGSVGELAAAQLQRGASAAEETSEYFGAGAAVARTSSRSRRRNQRRDRRRRARAAATTAAGGFAVAPLAVHLAAGTAEERGATSRASQQVGWGSVSGEIAPSAV